MNKKCLLIILTIVCVYFLFGKNVSAASSEAELAYQRAAAALKQGRLYGTSAEFSNFIDAEANDAIKPEMYLAAWAVFSKTDKLYYAHRAVDRIEEKKIKKQELLCVYYSIMAEKKFYDTNYDEASILIDKSINIKNKKCARSQARAHILKTAIMLKEGRNEEAKAEFNTWNKKSASFSNAADYEDSLLSILGVSVKKSKPFVVMSKAALSKYKSALAYYAYIARQYPDNLPVILDSATSLKDLGDVTSSMKYYTIALKIDPKSHKALNGIGFTYYQQYIDGGITDKDLLNKAQEYLERALVSDPDYNHSLNTMGLIYRERGDNKIAIDYFEKAIVAGEKRYSVYAKPYANLGDVYLSQENYSLAEDNFRKALKIDKNYWPAQVSYGHLYFQKQNYSMALIMYEKGYENYRSLDNFMNFFNAHVALDNYADAVKLAQEAKKSDLANSDLYDSLVEKYKNRNTSSTFYFTLGENNYVNGDYKDAIDNFSKSLEQDPNNADSYNYIGRAYSSIGRYEEAKQMYLKAAALAPKEYVFHYNIGLVYDYLRQYDLAKEAFDKAAALAEEDSSLDNIRKSSVYYMRGRSFAKLGLDELSLADCWKAIELNSNYDKPYGQIGEIFLKQGKKEEAIKNLKKGLEINPSNNWIRDTLIFANK